MRIRDPVIETVIASFVDVNYPRNTFTVQNHSCWRRNSTGAIERQREIVYLKKNSCMKLSQLQLDRNSIVAAFSCLARSANLLTALYILLALMYSLFLNWAKLLSTRPIFAIFHEMKGICVNFIDPNLLFWLLKGRCHGNQFGAKLAKWPSFSALAFRNGFEYRNFDFRLLNGNIFATFAAIFVKISPLTPEVTPGVSVNFRTRRQKSAYLTKYLSKYWTKPHQIFNIGRYIYGGYKTEISFALAVGTLL